MSLKLWKHKKTGKLYQVIYDNVINATNAQDGQIMVFYKNSEGMLFVREKKEFEEKFQKEEEI